MGEAMSDFYRFPAMAKLGELTNQQQASKLLDECAEAEKALISVRGRGPR